MRFDKINFVCLDTFNANSPISNRSIKLRYVTEIKYPRICFAHTKKPLKANTWHNVERENWFAWEDFVAKTQKIGPNRVNNGMDDAYGFIEKIAYKVADQSESHGGWWMCIWFYTVRSVQNFLWLFVLDEFSTGTVQFFAHMYSWTAHAMSKSDPVLFRCIENYRLPGHMHDSVRISSFVRLLVLI